MNEYDLSLIIPCYNEGEILIQSLDKIVEILKDTPYSWEMICIDDKSKDGTADIIKKFSIGKKNVRVYFHKKNIGRGGTVVDGIKKAKGKIVGFIDVDLEVSPVYIPEFIRTINGGFDAAIGKRIYKENFLSLSRYVASRIYVLFVKKLLNLKFEDTEAGYKFFLRVKILPFIKDIKDKGWFFDTEIIARCYWHDLRIASIPILFLRRKDKESTVRLIPDTVKYIKSIWRFKKETKNISKQNYNGLFILTCDQYYRHLKKYAKYQRPSEMIDWCAKISPSRTYRIVKSLTKYKNVDAKVLDLGCGIGLNTPSIAKYFPDTIAADVDPMFETATKNFLSSFHIRIPVITYDGKKLPFKDNVFDIVNCVEVIEHTENPDLLLSEIKRVLKPDGILYITSPNKYWPIESHYRLPFLSYLPRKFANIYVRLFKKDKKFDGIYLIPTYKEFLNMLGKYFNVEDITFKVIKNYSDYDLIKERGVIVILVAWILGIIGENMFLNKLLSNLSIGWLVIGRVKK